MPDAAAVIYPRCAQDEAAVARHYDELDTIYREIWGDHVHHGYWRTGSETPAQAVEELVRLLAERLDLKPGQRVCDIGCGYGASARFLVAQHRVAVTGLTVSQAQYQHGRAAQLAGQTILHQNWLANDLAAASFDCAYAIESSEHMADKQRFFDEGYRILRSGGRLVVFAWLARAGAQRWEVDYLLEPICREGRLPSMGSEDDYRRMAAAAGFAVESFEDLSAQVQRTWLICMRRVAGRLLSDSRYRRYLRDATARERRFGLSLLRILLAYRTGSMRYGLLTARKP